MKSRMLPLIMLILLAFSCKKDDITSDDFFLFDDTTLPTLKVSFDESEWKRLLSLYDADNRTKDYVTCNVTFQSGGRTIDIRNAGLRLRGQTSRRRPQEGKRFQHFHAGLHFTKFVPSNKQIDGYRRINLKYAKEDPSYIREHYCFDLMSRYGVWTAPKSSWCRLTLEPGGTPVYYGVYLMVESIDKQYLKKRPQFGSADGFLWKCAYGATLAGFSDNYCHLDDNTTKEYKYELKDDDPAAFETAKLQLKDFMDNFSKLQGDIFRDWAKSHIDIPVLLRMYAVNVAVGHWDDYWNNTNNFYVYFNSRDVSDYKLYMLPYDLDNTLGTTCVCGVQSDAGRQDPYNWGVKKCALISKLLTISEFRDMYTAYLKELAAPGNPWFDYDASVARIVRWQDLLVPWLDNDTGEDTKLRDRPASWSNHQEYRLIQDCPDNWFRVKAKVLNSF